MIQLQKIHLAFADQVIYKDVNLHIHPQSRIGLVGDNGTGKTTLLRLLMGELSPDKGQIQKQNRVQVGYLPQSMTLYEEIPLREYVRSAVGEITQLEQELAELHTRLEQSPHDEALLERLGRAQSRLESLDGYTLNSRAEKILHGLGFRNEDFERPVAEFSGGWQMRAALAKLLLEGPDLLLLDEPTNHLDAPTLEWLERWLKKYVGSMLIVSHDRYFLDRVVTSIAALARGQLRVFSGTYSEFERQKEMEREKLQAAYFHQQEKITELKRFIERFRYKASKASQVQSRVKMLEKMDLIEVEKDRGTIHFYFPPAPRSGEEVLKVDRVSKHYGDLHVFDNISFSLHRGEKVALVGVNGAGKSTLSRLITGRENPTSGRVNIGYKVIQQYYSQDVEAEMDPVRSVLQEVTRVAGFRTETEVRTLLGSFLFSGDTVQKQVKVLSGGEKSRLAVCKLLFMKANLLVLDEPTNHLDRKAKDILQQALSSYTGTLLVVSHDRWFLDRVVDRVLVLRDGQITDHAGTYTEYLEDYERKINEEGAETAAEVPGRADMEPALLNSREARKQRSLDKIERNRKIRKKQQKVDEVESRMAQVENKMKAIEAELVNPKIYEDAERLKKGHIRYNELKQKAVELEEAWTEAMEALEKIRQELGVEDE